MAVGTPFGQLSGTVTVRRAQREGALGLQIIRANQQGSRFLQTDASITSATAAARSSPRGEAIGINTAINPSGQGIGFAIPSIW